MRCFMSGPLSAVALAMLATPVPVLAQADPARVTVEALDASLLAAMKGGGTVSRRAAALAPAIDRAFDLPLMTRLAVGPGWTGIAPAEQQALVAAFRRLTIAQYAANFDSWSGESFAISPQIDARSGDRLIRTTLNTPGKAAIPIGYRLRASGGGWKIIDVFYRNAISQIAMRRSDFAAVLAKGGAKALIAHLDSLAAKGSF